MPAPERPPPAPPSQRLPSPRRLLALGIAIAALIAVLYLALPSLAGLDATWRRIRDGDPAWLAAAALLEACSFAGYIWLFRTVCARPDSRIGWRASYQVSMAGVVATRLLASGGAGGIALTAWALSRSGLSGRATATRTAAQLVLLYAVFMGALVVFGLGLRLGVLPGPAPFALTVVPAVFAAACIVATLVIASLTDHVDRGLRRLYARPGRGARLVARLATLPATVAWGVREALELIRAGRPGVLGAVAWWAFDIATLWACFHAFGEPPPTACLVVAYLVGALANVLPLPGGVGGVEGGMIGALIAFGVPGGLAIVAVLAYRAFAFWLPMLPGAIAYVQLLRTVRGWRTAGATA
jgi:putative heme transporter